jgi:LAO/AO transport system kinase
MSDIFIILQMPNAGDEIQGIKKGILELADLVVVTKSDGPNIPAAKLAQEHLEKSLSVARGQVSFAPRVLLVSGIEGTGFGDMWTAVQSFIEQQKKTGDFFSRRRHQSLAWYHAEITALVTERIFSSPKSRDLIHQMEHKVSDGELLGSTAASQVMDQIFPES